MATQGDLLSDEPPEIAGFEPLVQFAGSSQPRQTQRTLASREDGPSYQRSASPVKPRNLKFLQEYFQEKDSCGIDWLKKDEIPNKHEIASLASDGRRIQNVELEENQLEGPWPSVQNYLEVQYKLLREDCVSTLRDAVEDVFCNPNQTEEQSQVNARIYDRVYISGLTVAAEGIAHRLEFSTGRSKKRIAWTQSKRLKAGTLVALTPAKDTFRTQCLVGIVAARPMAQLEALTPSIDIYLNDPEEMEIDTQVEYIMVESSNGYFEAGRHVLRALQHMYHEKFPFTEHIVYVQAKVAAPSYLTACANLDISAALSSRGDNDVATFDIVNHWPAVNYADDSSASSGVKTPKNNPSLPNTHLDRSQFEALCRILAKRLAIVQGPPGTGKTHVSVMALRILLDNRKHNDPPIIIAAQTNHALDQLLRHVAPFAPNFIRLGGQTQDREVVEPQTLFYVKERSHKAHQHLRKARSSVQGSLDRLHKDLLLALEPMISPAPISPAFLFEEGLITAEQCESLENVQKDWIGETTEGADTPFGRWAGSAVKAFKRGPSRQPHQSELEDENEDADQLKDIELETGRVSRDHDHETLYGKKIAFHPGFIGDRSVGDTDLKIEELLAKFRNMAHIPYKNRGSVYDYLQQKAKARMLAKFRQFAKTVKVLAKELKIAKARLDVAFLSEAPVIGMTTTGLSKYRGLLASLQPQTVLIEEAAETQEAYVTAACFESLERLVLVGDHQQLQAHCQNPELEEFNLGVSLFERLVRYNSVEFQQLTMQRRMLPEMRKTMNIFYKNLTDHPSVLDRKDVPGMDGSNTWFMSHSTPESADGHFSWHNVEEAQLVAGFFEYLVRNGVDPKHITVLSFYKGQQRQIVSCLRNREALWSIGKINVSTVDSYQGEENDIILLSLVRNNARNSIGFLNIINRVCVALSRARRGLYVFGHAGLLAQNSDFWKSIIYHLRDAEPRRISRYLPITCKNHGKTIRIRSSLDWENTNGGCDQLCGKQLDCGHTCNLRCHPETHEQLGCFLPCNHKLPCGHQCGGRCSDANCFCNECERSVREHARRYLAQRQADDDILGLQSRSQASRAKTNPRAVNVAASELNRALPSRTPPAASQAWLQTEQVAPPLHMSVDNLGDRRTRRDGIAAYQDFASGGVADDDQRRVQSMNAQRAELAGAPANVQGGLAGRRRTTRIQPLVNGFTNRSSAAQQLAVRNNHSRTPANLVEPDAAAGLHASRCQSRPVVHTGTHHHENSVLANNSSDGIGDLSELSSGIDADRQPTSSRRGSPTTSDTRSRPQPGQAMAAGSLGRQQQQLQQDGHQPAAPPPSPSSLSRGPNYRAGEMPPPRRRYIDTYHVPTGTAMAPDTSVLRSGGPSSPLGRQLPAIANDGFSHNYPSSTGSSGVGGAERDELDERPATHGAAQPDTRLEMSDLFTENQEGGDGAQGHVDARKSEEEEHNLIEL